MPFYLEKPYTSKGATMWRRGFHGEYLVFEAQIGEPVVVGGEIINYTLYVKPSQFDPPDVSGGLVYSHAFIEVDGPARYLTFDEAKDQWAKHGIILSDLDKDD